MFKLKQEIIPVGCVPLLVLPTQASIATRCQPQSEVNKCEQVVSDDHQMSLAG